MKITVIVPVYNGGNDIRKCLAAIAASDRKAEQIIVVDDCSTDDAAKISANQHGFNYLRLENGPHGPAYARNKGVKQTDADILVFIDADVVVHADTLQAIENRFTSADAPDVLFGSYDKAPAIQSTVSKYKNLLHHYVHQNSSKEATTFWAGCGAIRREAFETVGGFDLSYERPSIEDIELGMRLSKAGYKIHLCPEIQVKHLKNWTLSGMIRTDIFCRAIPWTRLLSQNDGLINDLNLRTESRVSAAAVIAFIGSLLLAILFQAPPIAVVAVISFALFFTLEKQLFHFFRKTGGRRFAIKAMLLHSLYYLYASGAFVLTKAHMFMQDTVPGFAPAVALKKSGPGKLAQ